MDWYFRRQKPGQVSWMPEQVKPMPLCNCPTKGRRSGVSLLLFVLCNLEEIRNGIRMLTSDQPSFVIRYFSTGKREEAGDSSNG
jgi:hypothetical protein